MAKTERQVGDKPESPPDLGSAKAVGKTMSILELLAERRHAQLAEICSETSMNKSTAYRFLDALRRLGYVRQAEDGSYVATMKLAQLGALVAAKLDLPAEARPIVRELADETKETIHLATLEDDHLVYLDKVESTQSLRVAMMSRIGSSAPTYCTGVGKALLAFVDEGARKRTLARENLTQHTSNTITDHTRLEKELERVRKSGVALDNEEHEVGVRCVAAPVLDPAGRAIAAISVTAPSARLTDEKIPTYKRLVIDATRNLSHLIFQ